MQAGGIGQNRNSCQFEQLCPAVIWSSEVARLLNPAAVQVGAGVADAGAGAASVKTLRKEHDWCSALHTLKTCLSTPQLFRVVREWQTLVPAERAAMDLRKKRIEKAEAAAAAAERAAQREARQVVKLCFVLQVPLLTQFCH